MTEEFEVPRLIKGEPRHAPTADNRLTRVGDRMLTVIEEMGSDGRDILAVVMLRSRGEIGTPSHGCVASYGYGDDEDGPDRLLADAIGHLQAIAEAHDVKLSIRMEKRRC